MALKKLKDGTLQVKKGVTFKRPKKKAYKLPPKVKKQWLEALRSGKFRQTQGLLCERGSGQGGHPKYCCLGVLEKLHSGRSNKVLEGASDLFHETAQKLNLTSLGNLNEPISYVDLCGEELEANSCAELNDDVGLTFKQIADIIEVQF